MKELFKQLTIDRDFTFSGQKEDLVNVLKNTKGLKFQSIAEDELIFYPKISWGTMSGIFSTKINVRALITELDAKNIKIKFRTTLRIEHYLIIVLFAFSFGIVSADESKWSILYMFGLWGLCHLWFQFIYRYQENRLIAKVIEKLRLTKM